MKAISRRVCRLENRLGITIIETEQARGARQAYEAFRKRRAARLAREGLPPDDPAPNVPPGLRLAELIVFHRKAARVGRGE